MNRRTFHATVGLGLAARLGAAQPESPRRTLVERLEFFDGDLIFGPRSQQAEKHIIDPPFLTADEVLKELDRYRIREALLFHSACRDSLDPQANLALLKEIQRSAASRQRLHACWSVLPGEGRRLPEAARVIQDLRDHGARAVRVFPRNHGYRLEDLREILAALEEHHAPLLVDYGITFPHNDLTDWESVEWVLRNHPGLDLILCHPPSRKNFRIFQMMELSRRFHLSPAGFRIHQEVLAITRLFGPRALIYGSHLPYVTAAAPIAEVIYSGLREAEQKQIAGDTLRALLQGVRL